MHELREAGLEAEQQKTIEVHYHGHIVGRYVADLLVERRVLVEIKAVEALNPVHTAQCLNYLRATGLKICLLMNFSEPRVRIKRLVYKL